MHFVEKQPAQKRADFNEKLKTNKIQTFDNNSKKNPQENK